jgi:broad specificity phosphatase PhoE
MNTFYIARHGETENNKAKRLSGWIDTALTQKGLEPTVVPLAKLKQLPHIDALYSSDMGRAFITADGLCQGLNFPHEIRRTAGLREVNYGDAANMLSTEAYQRYPRLDRDTHYTPPKGESLDHMQQRVLKAIAEIDAQYTDATIVIVAHSGVMAALNASYQGIDFGHHNISEAYPHEYIGKFIYKDGKITSFQEFTGRDD